MKTLVRLFVLLCFVMLAGCLFADDEPLERGYVYCGDGNLEVVCQPGTYCSAPRQAFCHEGCVSDANCLDHEKCLKEKPTDRVGSCIPSKTPPCCK